MKPQDLNDRTLEFSVRVMNFIETLPETKSTRIITNQVLRSTTSIGANYRASCRAKSKRDFINKLKIVEEESDETLYWLQLLNKTKLGDPEILSALIKEANELVSIFVASINTAKANLELEQRKRTSTF